MPKKSKKSQPCKPMAQPPKKSSPLDPIFIPKWEIVRKRQISVDLTPFEEDVYSYRLSTLRIIQNLQEEKTASHHDTEQQ